MVRYNDVLTIIILSVPLAISWTQFLIAEDGILEEIGNRIDKIESKKIHKLLTCSVCLSGQASLWLYLILFYSTYSLLSHLVAVTCSMVIASFIMNKLMA